MSLPAFTFSPFQRPMSELGADDMVGLLAAREGWFVEYKRELKNTATAAKSLASFANQYGGWIVYGVSDPDKDKGTPTDFPGIPADEVTQVEGLLRSGAADCMQPTPHFETKVVFGPASSVNLPSGRALVVVRVPPGANAPYVHNDGRVYRRVADASVPKYETDRHVLDLLWQRSLSANARWRDFVGEVFPLSDAENGKPIAHVFLATDPYGDRGTELDMEFSEFVQLMRDAAPDSGGLPFDNFFPSERGFIARQTTDNDPHKLSLTWRQDLDGSASISLPLPYRAIDPQEDSFSYLLGGYDHADELASACERMGLSAGRLLDINVLVYVLLGSIQRYRCILNKCGKQQGFVVKVRIDDVWRTVPFLDSAAYARNLRDYGVPLVQCDTVYAPSGTSSSHAVAWELRTDLPDEWHSSLAEAIYILRDAAAGLGVMFEIQSLVADMGPLLERLKRVQQRRAGY